jgi:hypothetical protein
LPWRFQKVSKGFWKKIKNQKDFMDWAGKELNVQDKEDWYKVTSEVDHKTYFKLKFKDLENLGTLLKTVYSGSLYSLLSTVYPEYNWLPWKLKQVSKGFWNNIANQRNFVDWAGSQLQIKEMSDWYEVYLRVNFQANIVFISVGFNKYWWLWTFKTL